MTTRAEFWSDFDAQPRGTSEEPAIPPHAAFCIKHTKLYRGACPYCEHDKMYPGMAMDEKDPRFYMRGRKRA